MMYCEREDIEKRLGTENLVSLTSDGNEVDWGVVDDVIKKASGLIDSYLSGRYNVPFETVPDVVRESAITLALYFLYEQRAAQGVIVTPDDIKERYKDVITWLRDVASGKAGIVGVDIPAEASSGGVRYKTREKIFGDKFEEAY